MKTAPLRFILGTRGGRVWLLLLATTTSVRGELELFCFRCDVCVLPFVCSKLGLFFFF